MDIKFIFELPAYVFWGVSSWLLPGLVCRGESLILVFVFMFLSALIWRLGGRISAPFARLDRVPLYKRLGALVLDCVILLSIFPYIFVSRFWRNENMQMFIFFLTALVFLLRDLQGGRFSPGKRIFHYRLVSAEEGSPCGVIVSVKRNLPFLIVLWLAPMVWLWRYRCLVEWWLYPPSMVATIVAGAISIHRSETGRHFIDRRFRTTAVDR